MKKSLILTVLVFIFASLCLFCIPIQQMSAYSSIFSVAVALIAVIWFYNSLQLQSTQLDEQRKQFQLEFNNIKLESKRNTLLLVKEILIDMDKKVTDELDGIGKLENMLDLFIHKVLPALSNIADTADPNIVMEEIHKCNKILIPINMFLISMKDVFKLILENEGEIISENNYTNEMFVNIYGKKIKNNAFLSKYIGIANSLSGFMIQFKLEVIELASLAVIGLKSPRTLKNEEFISKINEFKNNNNVWVPKIVEVYLESLKTEVK
ncbi:MAG: hypothetical protein PHR82_08305 [Endomicrobiaceae bacterium]|nr:hypothetical protein [Endomicrobiaceae bacterium]